MHRRSWKLSLLAFSLALVSMQGISRYARSQQERLGVNGRDSQQSLKTGPAGADAPNDTQGKVLGDLQNGIEDLMLINRLIQAFQKRQAGKLPSNSSSLIMDIAKAPREYGFGSFSDAVNSLSNPDSRYADNPTGRSRPSNYMPYIILSKRIDGTQFGIHRAGRTRDVIAYTDIYSHSNVHILSEEHGTVNNPVGFFLVLWDDGQIEEIPYDLRLYVASGQDYLFAFPNQAGVPSDCLSYDEFWTKVSRLRLAPRGKPVPDGEVEPIRDNGAGESLVALSRSLAKIIDRERMWNLLGVDKETFSLQQIQEAAQRLGLTLAFERLTLQDISQRGYPAILHLKEPDQIITLLASGLTHALISDQGMTRTMNTTDLSKRYTGEALAFSVPTEGKASVRIEKPVRVLDVAREMETVSDSVKVSNGGKKDLELLAELPACGCADIDPLQETLKPGQSVNVRVRIPVDRWLKEWGTRLVLVTLKTNDPAWPRATLGFQMNLVNK